MKRHIAGLHGEYRAGEVALEGAFLAQVDRVFYRWHPERPFYVLRFIILEPNEHQGRSFTGRLYCTSKALWNHRRRHTECPNAAQNHKKGMSSCLNGWEMCPQHG